MLALACAVVVGGVTALAIHLFLRDDPPPIFGVYQQKGRWYPLKYLLFQIIYRLRKWQNQSGSSTASQEKQLGYGVTPHHSIAEMDTMQPLSSHPKAFDAVFFMGVNKNGYFFVAGTERRQLGVINGLCYIVVPDIGLLCSKKLPDTVLFGAKPNEFSADGISLKPIKPMSKWRTVYEGKMWKKSAPLEVYDVKFEGEWTSTLPYFNFDSDLHPSAVARAIAKEPWTRNYFKNLKEAHQTHYEQMGSMRATITVNGKMHKVTMDSFRDHSFGQKRDWNLMHRYAFFMFFLDNGMKATVGIICQPCTGSMLETGYVYTAEGELNPLEWCDFQLYQHGENGIPPDDHGFQFKAGSIVYTAQIEVLHQAVHYVGWNWEARMVERFVKCEVNGIPGHGISEFHYHHKSGRPKHIMETDPQWFQTLKNK